ncbi:MAG: protein kinase [Polyangiales bacterium]
MLRQVERYELLEEIGHGGMAIVYRARDTKLNRLVALKILHPHLQRTEEATQRFTREAQSVARLQHPRILEVYDYSGPESEEMFIGAELLTGPTLKAFANSRKQIPAEIAACFALQIAEALIHAHAHGIVHRDVKPENVLLHRNEGIKLTDFGIARLVDTQTFTATGQVLGSPGHMAPEQIETGECDERTDIFALGTVLYFIAVGRLPFIGRNPHHLLKLVLGGEFPDPLRLRPSVGDQLSEIMRKAMAYKPDDRYATASEMADALRAFLKDSGIDDPDSFLTDYLRASGDIGSEIDRRTVDTLLLRGENARTSGDVASAQRAFSRVLALDEGNVIALEGLEKLTRRQRVLRSLTWVLLALFAISAGAFAASLYGENETNKRADSAVPLQRNAPAMSQPPAQLQPVAEVPKEVPPKPASEPSTRNTNATTTNAAKPSATTPATNTTREPKDSAARDRQRLVVFKPSPQNVLIGVDGATPKPYGPAFQSIELSPGRHRFNFIGAADCCKDVNAVITLPPGNEPFELQRTLEYKDARLYVESDRPARAHSRCERKRSRGPIAQTHRVSHEPLRAACEPDRERRGPRRIPRDRPPHRGPRHHAKCAF